MGFQATICSTAHHFGMVPINWLHLLCSAVEMFHSTIYVVVLSTFALRFHRFMVEVTKRFRDTVLVDKAFQERATQTLPKLVAKWKVRCRLLR